MLSLRCAARRGLPRLGKRTLSTIQKNVSQCVLKGAHVHTHTHTHTHTYCSMYLSVYISVLLFRSELGWLLDRLTPGIASLLPPSLCSKILHTLATFDETYRTYEFDEVCVAFNGGKDCTAMLDLLHSYLTMCDTTHTHIHNLQGWLDKQSTLFSLLRAQEGSQFLSAQAQRPLRHTHCPIPRGGAVCRGVHHALLCGPRQDLWAGYQGGSLSAEADTPPLQGRHDGNTTYRPFLWYMCVPCLFTSITH